MIKLIQKIIDKNWSKMTIVVFLCRAYIYILNEAKLYELYSSTSMIIFLKN